MNIFFSLYSVWMIIEVIFLFQLIFIFILFFYLWNNNPNDIFLKPEIYKITFLAIHFEYFIHFALSTVRPVWLLIS